VISRERDENLCLPEAKGEYHAKLGVFEDSKGDTVSFKGSVNESWTGWHERGNHETLDVFCSWKTGRDQRQVRRNTDYFSRLWNDDIAKLKVVPFPNVCRKKLESVAKNSIDEIITKYEPFELLAYVTLKNSFADPETYSESTHDGKEFIAIPNDIYRMQHSEVPNGFVRTKKFR